MQPFLNILTSVVYQEFPKLPWPYRLVSTTPKSKIRACYYSAFKQVLCRISSLPLAVCSPECVKCGLSLLCLKQGGLSLFWKPETEVEQPARKRRRRRRRKRRKRLHKEVKTLSCSEEFALPNNIGQKGNTRWFLLNSHH